ncbi:hypothetical protein HMPREF9220_0535 [Dialister micraerophilus UPII 345-E]|uniref:Uncharacterized protein n=1 Tax=Dialister micraerophilus UPII 345-E TaxID=910314 RepID=E4LA23_9FIRM|nr:hypothetical protein HMPREF9220_0535 [Dialister micraerophilus UPII 345-E]
MAIMYRNCCKVITSPLIFRYYYALFIKFNCYDKNISY